MLSHPHKKALRDIRDCRTPALGGHLEEYDCGHRIILYNSCRSRYCPKCQAMARAHWLAEREKELLPVPYFHVI
ncbi:MAG TPA: transposase zinc-binding domain-containing protein [Candidatus Methylomirabilis sp.]|nr:transposase zinc-binding domain-containing protein [Candidatus Methylomirabilis sp.]